MGHIISSIKKKTNRVMHNMKAKNSNSCENDTKNNIIDAYDEHGLGRMFKMEFMTETNRKEHKSKKENIKLQEMNFCQSRNSWGKEKYLKVFENNRERGYDDVISHLKLVISTARGEDIPLRCFTNNSIKSKSVYRREKIQTTVL